MPYKDPTKQRAYGRKHYKDNKQYYLDRNRINRARLRGYVINLKQSSPCKDCGVQYPHYVMDFDHLGDKQGLIAEFVRRHNKKALEDEIAKCEIVCSNCHRKRSYERLILKNGVASDGSDILNT